MTAPESLATMLREDFSLSSLAVMVLILVIIVVATHLLAPEKGR